MAKRGVDLSISVVGFQVNDRVRTAAAVHRQGGRRRPTSTSPTPTSSATSSRRCSRAPSAPTSRPGPRSTGGAAREQATALGSGALPRRAARQLGRALVLDRRARGAAARSSRRPRSRAHGATGAARSRCELLRARRRQETRVRVRADQGRDVRDVYGATLSPRACRSGRRRPAGALAVCDGAGRDRAAAGSTRDIPVEIGVQLLKPGEDARAVTRRPGELAGADADRRRPPPKATTPPAPPPDGGSDAWRAGCWCSASAWRASRRAGRRRRARPQGGRREASPRSTARPAAGARPSRRRAQDADGDAGGRRRLVQRRADPRAGQLPRHDPARASTSTTASSSRPGSGCSVDASTSPRSTTRRSADVGVPYLSANIHTPTRVPTSSSSRGDSTSIGFGSQGASRLRRSPAADSAERRHRAAARGPARASTTSPCTRSTARQRATPPRPEIPFTSRLVEGRRSRTRHAHPDALADADRRRRPPRPAAKA